MGSTVEPNHSDEVRPGGEGVDDGPAGCLTQAPATGGAVGSVASAVTSRST